MTVRVAQNPPLPATLQNGATGSLLVTSEKVWLTDPTLPFVADPTGAADSSPAITAAIAKAASINNGYGSPSISGPPGLYKCLSSHYFPAGVTLATTARSGGTTFSFPTDTGAPALAFTSSSVSAGVATIPFSRGGLGATTAAFAPASGGSPQTVLVGGQLMTYTGVTGTAQTGTLTGVVGNTLGLPGNLPLVQGYAMQFGRSGNVGGEPTIISEGILVKGPATGTLAAWGSPTPPNSLDGVYIGAQHRMEGTVYGFRMGTAYAEDHEQWGSTFKASGCYAAIHAATPNAPGGGGDQSIDQGVRLDGQIWAGIYVEASCALINLRMTKAHMGFAPWGIYKASLTGGSTDYPYIATFGQWDTISFEAIGLGVIGCGDALSALLSCELTNCISQYTTGHIPPVGTPGPAIVGSVNNCKFIGPNFFTGLSSSSPAYIQGATISGHLGDLTTAINLCTSMGIPFAIGPAAGSTSATAKFLTGGEGGVEGMFATPFDTSIVAGDVCGWRNSSTVERFQRNPQAVAGVAVLPAASGAVPILGSSQSNVTVNVLAQSTPPTSPAAAGSATAGTLAAATYFYKFAHVLSGGGVTAPSTEVSVTLSGSNSAALSWTNLATIPHGQTITATRIYRGTSAGAETGYALLSGTGTTFTDSGSTLTAGAPQSQNVGCEIYGSGNWVRGNPGTPGKACVASSQFDTNGTPFAWTFSEPDNGSTASVRISPALGY